MPEPQENTGLADQPAVSVRLGLPPEPPAPSRPVQRAEVAVFLLLFAPTIVFSFLSDHLTTMPFPTVVLSTILNNGPLSILILYFLWRNGEPVARVGIVRKGVLSEAVLGLLLFIPVYYLAGVFAALPDQFGTSPSFSMPDTMFPRTMGEKTLAVLYIAVVAISEELIFRGYLLHRLTALTKSTLGAVGLSTLIFSAAHAYQGPAGMIGTAVVGLAFAGIFLWRRNLMSLVVMHFIMNVIALLAPR